MPDTQSPTAEEFFGPAPTPPTADEFFGPQAQAENERQRYRMINQGVASSPLQDFLMSENGPVGTAFHSAGRIARSFGQDFSEEFSQSTGLSQETKDAIKRWTGYDSWSKKHRDIAKAASNVLLDRPALALSVAVHTIQGAFTGGQAAVAQLGEEVGQPRLGREIAAIPEAFMGTPHPIGMPGRAIAEAERARSLEALREPAQRQSFDEFLKARSLDVIGPNGEAGWKGTAPPPSEEVAKPAARPAAAEAAEPILPPESPAEAKAQEEGQAAAAQRRGATLLPSEPAAEAPAAPTAIERPALPPVPPDHVRFFHGGSNPTSGGGRWVSPHYEYARDYRPGEPVNYVDIPQAWLNERFPDTELYTGPYAQPYPSFEAPEEFAKQMRPVHEAAPEATPEPSGRSIEEQRDFIRNDVARQLIEAGRPREEAEAAGALIAARYETRANLLQGARGTPEELYRAEAPEILGPGARTQQPLPPQPPRPVNEARLSLLEFLAHKGGLQRTADLESILDKNPTVGRFGRLFRDEGMTPDRARELASEAGYLAENVERTGKQATVKDLLDAIQNEARGRKVYRQGYEPPAAAEHPLGPEPPPLEGGEEARAPEERSALMTEGDERELTTELLQSLPTIEGAGVRLKEEREAPSAANVNFTQKEVKANLPPPKSFIDRIWDNYAHRMTPEEFLESEPLWGGAANLSAERGISESEAFAEIANEIFSRMGANKYMSPQAARRYMAGMRGIRVVEEPKELYQRQRPTEPPNLIDIPGFHIGPNFLSPNELYQIKAFHGSPHDFDRFDISRIGTGEGAQAYGHGLYFAESEGTAKSYRERLSGLQNIKPDAEAQAKYKDKWDQLVQDRRAALGPDMRGNTTAIDAKMDAVHDLMVKDTLKRQPESGRLYQVSIKADPEHFLDWDKPLSEHSPEVENKVLSVLSKDERERYENLKKYAPESMPSVGASTMNMLERSTGGDRTKMAESLRQAGIPGIKYLDQGSRGLEILAPHETVSGKWVVKQVPNGKEVYRGDDEAAARKAFAENNTRNYVVFDDKLIEITHKDGTPVEKADRDNIVQELFQRARGGITLTPQRIPGREFLGAEDVKPILRLSREANASTFIHESGHQFLAELMRDAEHEAAPEQLKADAKTTLEWLGVEKAEDIARKHHEKFATAFEQYLREGVAPSPGLARVFYQFKQWLLRIYETIKGLGQPINEDIKNVFDRLLAEEPARTELIPERERPPTFASEHERAAESTPPEQAAAVAENVRTERHSEAAKNLLPEEQHVRPPDVAAETQRVPPGDTSLPSAGHEAGALAREAGAYPEPGAIGAGRAEAVGEGAGAPPGAGKAGPSVKTEPPATANAPFEGPKSSLIDKAGNIRLDKLDTPDDVTQVIRNTAAGNDNFWAERRGVLSDAETLDMADALGMDPAWLDRKKIGQAFSVEEIRAARRLLVQSATAVRDAMIAAKDGSTESLIAFGEAMRRHEMIQAKVSQATAEAGRALRAFREVIPGAENVALLDTWLKDNTGRTLFQLQEMARYGSNLHSPSQVSRFVFDTANGKIKQAVVYYYVNSLISGPITHLRYAAGNALTALYTPIVKIPIAATIGAARRLAGAEGERVYLGEAGAQLYGLIKGSREGLSAALEGWRTGNTPHLPGEEAPNMFEAQPVAPPIPGAIGRILGIPGKSVGAIHGFFSALRYEQEIHGMAYRAASDEGLSGQAFINRVADLVDRPTADMMEKASTTARRDLYMAPSDYQSLEAKLARISNHNVATKVILPFVKIGTQITARAFEGTPLAPFQKQVRENLSGRNGAAARDMQLATMAGGTALMATMAGMVLEGLATGDGPSDPGQRAVWLLNHHPNSIQIGDVSVSYARLGALGMLLRTAANTTEAYRGWGEDQGNIIAGDFLYGFEKAVLEEGFLTGVKEMIDAIYHHEEYGQRYLAQMITNWAPWSIGFGQVARVVDPYQRETRANTFLDALWKDLEAKTPWGSQALYPRRDMFGQSIPQAGPVQNYANDPVVQRMDALHMKVGRLQRKIRGVDLTDEQYDDYARIAGKTTKMFLDNLVQPGFEMLPQTQQVELIHKMITEGRKVGENAVIMQAVGSDNDIMRKSMENKVEKITGKPETVH